MQADMIKEEKLILRVRKHDSMGRSRELADQMSQNDPRPIKLGEKTRAVHELCEESNDQYPRVMYKAAINKDGVPNGDPYLPTAYPLPFDLAAEQGFVNVGFKVKGARQNDGGHVLVFRPYKTKLCGIAASGISFEEDRAK